MEFAWTEAQADSFAQTLKFAADLQVADDGNTLDRRAWTRAGEFGLLGLSLPESHGGMGLGALDSARMMEAFGQGCQTTGLVFSAAAHLFACAMPIAEYGGPELRQRVLPRLASGQWVGANAITEAGAGSDVFALKTRGERDGDGWRLSGEKSYVTNGPAADVLLVYAVTNPKHGHLGISAFVVPSDAPGVTIGRPFAKMGLRGSPIGSVYFEDVRLPADALVGRPGQGAAMFRGSMRWERACLFGLYLGVMERQLARCVAYARERRQGGRAIGDYQAVAHRLVDMKLRVESARLLLYRACWRCDRGEDAELDVCMAKLAVSEAAVAVALDAIRIFGGAGVMAETGIEAALRDAVPGTIFSGTSDVQRNLIAQQMDVIR